MAPGFAQILCFALILLLYYLDSINRKEPFSIALMIPYVWLFLISSRSVSEWLGYDYEGSLAELYAEGNPLNRAVYFSLMALSLMVLIKRRFAFNKFARENVPLLIFMLYCCVSITWSNYPEIAFKRWVKAAGEILVVLLIYSEKMPHEAVITMLKRIGFIQLPLSILYIKYFPSIGRAYTQSGMPDYRGVCTQKNQLGHLCLVMGFVFVWLIIQLLKSRKYRSINREMIIYSVMAICAIYLLVVSNSATSIVCIIIGFMMYFVSGNGFVRRNKRMLPALMFLFFVIMAGLQYLVDVESMFFRMLGRNTTFTGRTEIWGQVLSRVSNPLFGTGFMSFWLGNRLNSLLENTGWSFELTTSHNGYIETYINCGLVGLVLLGLFLIAIFRNSLSRFETDFEQGRFRISILTMVLIANITEAAFRSLSLLWFTLLIIAGIECKRPGTVLDYRNCTAGN